MPATTKPNPKANPKPPALDPAPPASEFRVPTSALDPIHDSLFLAYLNAAVSLTDIADHFGITVPDIMLWLHTPRVQHELAEFREAVLFRAEILAAAGSPATVDTLLRVNQALADIQPDENTPITVTLRLADTARKTAATLHRIAGPRPRRPQQQQQQQREPEQEPKQEPQAQQESTPTPQPVAPTNRPAAQAAPKPPTPAAPLAQAAPAAPLTLAEQFAAAAAAQPRGDSSTLKSETSNLELPSPSSAPTRARDRPTPAQAA